MENAIANNRTISHAAGAAGIAVQVASAYFFLLFPALTVPTPVNYVFFVAWFLFVGLALAWWRRHPWRSLLVPVVTVPIVIVVLDIGTRFLGWAP